MKTEPTNAELIATAASLILAMRRMIVDTNRKDPMDVETTLDSVQEFLAVSGGSLITLADRLGWGDEVTNLVHQGQDRLNAAQACQGLSGRA